MPGISLVFIFGFHPLPYEIDELARSDLVDDLIELIEDSLLVATEIEEALDVGVDTAL
jgi:hypothetical protein